MEEQQEGEEQSREKTTEEVLADLRRQQEEMRAIIRCMSRQSLEDVEREEEERKLPEFQEEMALISAAEEDPEYIFIGEQLEIISRIPSLRDAVLDDVRMWDSEAPLFTKDTPVQELRLTLVDLVNVAETEARKAEIESQLEETFGGSGPEETAALILKEFKDRGITKAGVGVDFSKEIAQEIRKNIPFKYRVGNVSKNKIQESDFGKYLFSQYRNDSAYIAAAREIISGIDSREELLKNMSLLLYLWPKSSAKAYRKTAAKHMLREIWTALENF